MGAQFDKKQFSESDFAHFHRELMKETLMVRDWIRDGRFSEQSDTMGVELEGWIINNATETPNPVNETFISEMSHPQVVSELSKYNIELNSLPEKVEGEVSPGCKNRWRACGQSANCRRTL
ncbi:MAG: hypothetical protein R2827_09825 [Bdellovibrionales bacterium]